MSDAPAPDVSKAAPKLGKVLGRKIGPLPAGAWLLAIGGGLGIAYFIRGRDSESYTGDEYPAEDWDGAGYDVPTGGTGGAGYSDPFRPGTGGGGSDDWTDWPGTGDDEPDPDEPAREDRITNNNQWRRKAVSALVAAGVGAFAAERAVGKYLAGKPLSKAQRELVNRAIAAVGPTPRPVPLPTLVQPPKPPPKDNGGKGKGGKGKGGKGKGGKPGVGPAGGGKQPPKPSDPKPPRRPRHSAIAHHSDPTHDRHASRNPFGPGRRDTGVGR